MDENPYTPPTSDADSATVRIHPEIAVRLERCTWAFRRLVLSGNVDAIVEYNGRGLGHESVLVDGDVATRASAALNFATPIEFELNGHAARIEVRTWLFFFVGGFRLYVDDLLAYSEGGW